MSFQETRINSRKYDGTIHRTWNVQLVSIEKTLLTFVGIFDREIVHQHLGIIRRGTISYEYYWLDKWFNIFRFHEPTGELRNFYCNINLPPTFENNVLDYIDLEIDILVKKTFEVEILDIDEFEEFSIKYGYSENLKKKAFQTLRNVLKMVNKKEFPFTDTSL